MEIKKVDPVQPAVSVQPSSEETQVLPTLVLRGLVIFPGMMLQFDVGRKKSVLALGKSMEEGQLIFLVTQKDLSVDDPGKDDLYSIGVIARIRQIVRKTDDGIRLFTEGLCRAKICSIPTEEPFIQAEVKKIVDKTSSRPTSNSEALIRYTQSLFEEYIQKYTHVPPDIVMGVVQKKDCGELADYIAMNISLDFDKKQEILEELHPYRRLKKLSAMLKAELRILEIESHISEKAKDQIDENQRDYYLREQMKAIADELGEGDNPLEEADELRKSVNEAGLPQEQKEKLLKECDRLARMPEGSHEGSVIITYIETCLSLPWSKSSKEHIDLKKARRILDRDHYGLTKVKDRIIESLAVKKLNPDVQGQILCLVGPPGVGKTSIAHSVAEAMGREYVRVSLGGVHDESDIRGHRRTYIGAMPGRIIDAIRKAGTNNPVLLLDEVDKLGNDYHGDPSSALLEVLDSAQNSTFEDHYIDLPFDLSKVFFITTANDISGVPEPLYDRMDVITLGSYTHEEKFQIGMKYLIPKQLKNSGIAAKNLRISQAAVHKIIDGYTREAGVRGLERQISTICRKSAVKIVENPETTVRVTPKNLETFLGPQKFREEALNKKDTVGLVNGLAWTTVGGEMLPIEVAVMSGTGKIELTGSLGDVMKESARTAISCIRTRANQLGIAKDFYSKYDIHIHAPEGAVPKDGPSAGAAMATAITSALTNIPVRHDIAMTGEITLLGRILPIGGLREKTMAAYRAGIKTVLIPAENVSDLEEVDKVVKDAVQFLPMERIDQVLDKALTKNPFQAQ
ncbi:MAG: endopeptidase La [Oscillospiraceae bacterium]|jgi:ATP-dependent Lon protease|nr:endopeptidase La [Oscillospiraceae bacterium]